MYDVVVVGAGPAGSAAARACAEKGLTTLCIEEHGTIGYPIQCAGLLSIAAWEECRVSRRSILHEVRGARFINAMGEAYTLNTDKTKAFVVDRGILDREMANAILDAGGEIRIKTAVRAIMGTKLVTSGIRGREEIESRLVIAADGVRSGIARMQGFPRFPVILTGLQADVRYEMDPAYVEVHPHASSDFFGWVIPLGRNHARIGLCGEFDVKSKFFRFMKKFPGARTHFVSGALPLGVLSRTYGMRTMVVGDAAGFAKPTSGGGVYTGVRSARHAAEVAARCFERETYDDRSLAMYERRWKSDFGWDLALGFRLFEIRRSLSSSEIDRLLSVLQDPDILKTIIRW
ncbi:MAG: NAD(P)/FAD-dependent oxidoreductase, partial [Methanomicrobiales archaeon]|nr:NAD(P)/FAD-dependent oxidoreductase [Methanomicrobiales archaeon]